MVFGGNSQKAREFKEFARTRAVNYIHANDPCPRAWGALNLRSFIKQATIAVKKGLQDSHGSIMGTVAAKVVEGMANLLLERPDFNLIEDLARKYDHVVPLKVLSKERQHFRWREFQLTPECLEDHSVVAYVNRLFDAFDSSRPECYVHHQASWSLSQRLLIKWHATSLAKFTYEKRFRADRGGMADECWRYASTSWTHWHNRRSGPKTWNYLKFIYSWVSIYAWFVCLLMYGEWIALRCEDATWCLLLVLVVIPFLQNAKPRPRKPSPSMPERQPRSRRQKHLASDANAVPAYSFRGWSAQGPVDISIFLVLYDSCSWILGIVVGAVCFCAHRL